MGPSFFAVYLDVMELWLMLQLEEDNGNTFFFQQDVALLHFHCNVTQFLNNYMPGRWIGIGRQ
jgi:hypothetical protein